MSELGRVSPSLVLLLLFFRFGAPITVNKNRPVNLDLRTIKLPVMARASILHRISGFVLFLSLPCLIYSLQMSLASAESFDAIRTSLSSGLTHLAFVVALMAITYHLIAGIRHLIMDMGHGESLEGGQKFATAVLVLGIGAALAVGVWVW